jgi:hypothetical protein
MTSCQGHRLAFLTLLPMVAACVVPVGPKWTDPQVNAPPTLSSANPAVGSILDFSAGGNAPLGVEVVLADQNTQDTLYLRWIIDYPPYVEGPSHVAMAQIQPGGNQIPRPSVRFAPNCSDEAISRDPPIHRLLLAASDRPFLDDDPHALDRVPDGNYRVEAAWSFSLTCP